MGLDDRLRRLERQERPAPRCPACCARDGVRVVIWRYGMPKPNLDCRHCQARVLVFREVREGILGQAELVD